MDFKRIAVSTILLGLSSFPLQQPGSGLAMGSSYRPGCDERRKPSFTFREHSSRAKVYVKRIYDGEV